MVSNKRLRVGFMGTPDFALTALKALVQARYDIVCVYSQPPRSKGRGQHVQPSTVHAYALECGIPVFTPVNFREEDARRQFASHDLDIAVVAAYGLILPEAVLNAPRFGCLNIHASLLPRWRGAAPIQYSIWKGDHETGVTIMQMEKGLDTGPMIAKKSVPITDEKTSTSLHDELAQIGGELIVEVLNELAKNGQINAEAQDNSITTYASMLKKEDGIINWNHDAFAIDRQIRALNPWPGVWTHNNGQRLKILKACAFEKSEGFTGQPATLLDKDGHILCGNNTVLKLDMIQPEGKKPMDLASALNGGYLKIGGKFT